MQTATVEEKLLKFGSPAAAYSWAAEVLSKYPVESQMARLQKRIGCGEFTMDELRDQALTIASVVARAQPVPGRLLFEYVYGATDDGEIPQELIDAIMRDIYNHVPVSRKKHHYRVVTLICHLVEGYRRRIQENDIQTNVQLALHVGVRKQNFKAGGWQDMTDLTRRSFQQWMEMAERNIDESLRGKGFLR